METKSIPPLIHAYMTSKRTMSSLPWYVKSGFTAKNVFTLISLHDLPERCILAMAEMHNGRSYSEIKDVKFVGLYTVCKQ